MATKGKLGIGPLCALVAFGALVACVGSDPAPSGSTPSDAGGSSSGGSSGGSSGAPADDGGSTLAPDAAPPVGCPLNCLPPAPQGWTGPSAVFDGTPDKKPAECPTLYTAKEVDAMDGIHADPATCGCGPASNSGARCNASLVRYTNTDCTSLISSENINSTACSTAFGSVGSIKVIGPPTIVRGTCTYSSPTKTVPAATFDKVAVACGLPTAAPSCENRADCVAAPIPEAPYSRLCIHQKGEQLCPSADYAVRFISYEKVDEGRDCNAATCAGTPSGGSCGFKYATGAYTTLQCSAAPVGLTYDKTVDVTCLPVGGNTTHKVHPGGFGYSNITCSQTAGATPIGEAKLADAVTFCCSK